MEILISSVKNPRLKAAAELRERKARDESGRFLIDGQREILRAVAAGVELLELYECGETVELPPSASPQRYRVAPAAFSKLAYGDRTRGTTAVARHFPLDLGRFNAANMRRLCIYAGVEKPGNVGALLRTADAAGIDGVILADARTDPFNPNVVRASAGALFTAPLAAASAAETLEWLRANRFRIVAARVDGAVDYREIDWSPPCAIVLGSEAEGLSDAWRGEDIAAVSLPMRGKVDSLNVSVTAGILLYEMTRSIRP